MTRETLQTLIRGKMDPCAIVVDFTEHEPGTGVVAYVRDTDFQPFVTQRWATHRTDGSPVETGIMLFSGEYEDHAGRWMMDYHERAGTP